MGFALTNPNLPDNHGKQYSECLSLKINTMIAASLPENESERLRKLNELAILDTLEEQAYDDLTYLAAQICGTPIALVSLVDTDRQWFKSHYGLDATETPRDLAFCAHAILNDDLFLVNDSSHDQRFFDNPLVTGEPHVKFYAGAPLIMGDNIRIGTLCVIDHVAKTITAEQMLALKALARQVVSQLDLRLKVKEREQLDHTKDEFISMINHELRTPLTAIYGSLRLIENMDDQMPSRASGLAKIAVRNAERLLAIVNDVLDISKLEMGKLELELKPVDLISVLQQAVELNRSYCTQLGCSLVLDTTDSGSSLTVLADEKRLMQVLYNLISNAAKFSDKGTAVEVSLHNIQNMARVSITNSGPGIALDQQKFLFQKFKQLTASNNHKLPGTGLGLSICKHLIEMQHGEIGFESVPGAETTFHFSLPRHNG